MRKIALDLGKRRTAYSEVVDGEVVGRTTVRRLEALRSRLGPEALPAVVAIEACRDAWHVHDVLTEWGNRVLIVDTTRVRQLGIGQHGKKTDRIDADTLALALDRGNIPTAHVLSPRSRRVREELTIRAALVKTRSEYITQCRALLQARGVTVRRCTSHVFARVVYEMELPSELLALVKPLLQMLPQLDQQIAVVEESLHAIVGESDTAARLATIPGVALLVATSFICVIDDPKRFRNASEVAAYLGLVPLERSSGGKRRLGGITKQGNPHVRRLLVQSAWRVLRCTDEDPLTLWAKRVSERRGRRIAVVAVARRLARLMWALWRHERSYDPNHVVTPAARQHDVTAADLQAHANKLRAGAAKLAKQRKESARRGQMAHELTKGDEVTMAL